MTKSYRACQRSGLIEIPNKWERDRQETDTSETAKQTIFLCRGWGKGPHVSRDIWWVLNCYHDVTNMINHISDVTNRQVISIFAFPALECVTTGVPTWTTATLAGSWCPPRWAGRRTLGRPAATNTFKSFWGEKSYSGLRNFNDILLMRFCNRLSIHSMSSCI